MTQKNRRTGLLIVDSVNRFCFGVVGNAISPGDQRHPGTHGSQPEPLSPGHINMD